MINSDYPLKHVRQNYTAAQQLTRKTASPFHHLTDNKLQIQLKVV